MKNKKTLVLTQTIKGNKGKERTCLENGCVWQDNNACTKEWSNFLNCVERQV
jgi:hypothetical protein